MELDRILKIREKEAIQSKEATDIEFQADRP
jgi:hypothetical protein